MLTAKSLGSRKCLQTPSYSALVGRVVQAFVRRKGSKWSETSSEVRVVGGCRGYPHTAKQRLRLQLSVLLFILLLVAWDSTG